MIYIAAHKRFENPCLDNYIPIQVGAKGKIELGFLKDCDGENISEKNANYCELTALYWVWKNTNDSYKGLVHYRRYFGRNNLSSNVKNIYSYTDLVKFLKESDIILPYIEIFKQNAKDEIMRLCCTEKIFNELRNSVESISPDFLGDFDQYFSQNRSCLFNMMFCKAELFDSYCEWLFNILFDLEKKVNLSELNTYQQRLFGFLSERLLNVWVKHNRLIVKNVPIINVEMPMKEKIILVRRRITNRMYYFFKKK